MIPLSARRPFALIALASVFLAPFLWPAAPASARPLRPGPAYWLASADGGVFAFGRAAHVGAATDAGLQRPITGIADTPDGGGYWLASRDGGVFAFGNAPYLGGAAGLPLNRSVVAIASTATGKGYWLVGSDGGVFAFGDAQFRGSVSGTPLNSPIVDMAATRSGEGYWLVGADGGVFAFGDARYHGAISGVPLNKPVVDIAATRSNRGYWITTADGGVFAFGDATFFGGVSHEPLKAPVVGIAPTRTSQGYWLAAADGGVFAFGDAAFFGGANNGALRRPVVGIAAGMGTHVPAAVESAMATTFGWDVSWPQCGRNLANLPRGRHGYAIVGVTRGHLYSVNECLTPEHHWSMTGGGLAGLYINSNYPYREEEPQLAAMFADACEPSDLGCQLYQYGLRGARQAVKDAHAAGVSAPLWWLDVETVNRWSPDVNLNTRIVRGVIDGLLDAKLRIGVYSTAYQWQVITGGMQIPGVPLWIATGGSIGDGPPTCTNPGKAFAGGVPYLVQFLHEGLDGNVLCEAGLRHARTVFRAPPPPPVPEFERGLTSSRHR
ncbi:MAG: hypothetical protein M3394_03815 [Actinomycetota bacterium]|nr:hypothetical protein [Actinomycetota bacterium]